MKTTSILLTIMFVCGSAMADTTWEGAYWGDSDPTQAPYDVYDFDKNGSQPAYFGQADGGYDVAVLDGSASAGDKIAYRTLGTIHLGDLGPALLGARMRTDAGTEYGGWTAKLEVYAVYTNYWILIAKDRVMNRYGGTIAMLDTTVYHEYLLETPAVGPGNTPNGNLYIDGTKYTGVLQGVEWEWPAGTPAPWFGEYGLKFGDDSSSYGGKSYWDYVGWATDTDIIPEPMTVTLLGIGGLCTLIRRRR